MSKKQDKHKLITKIQSQIKGFLIRKELKKSNDKYTYKILIRRLDKYINDLEFNREINLQLSKKKIRNENFPPDISENIAKFAIYKKYNIMPC